MIQTFMAFFGYVKVPLPVIHLCLAQEDFFVMCISELQSQKSLLGIDNLGAEKLFIDRLAYQKALTKFLRSGRLFIK